MNQNQEFKGLKQDEESMLLSEHFINPERPPKSIKRSKDAFFEMRMRENDNSNHYDYHYIPKPKPLVMIAEKARGIKGISIVMVRASEV